MVFCLSNFNSKEINNERRNNKMEKNNNSNELILVESKSMRDQMVSNVTDERMNEVLNKVKGLILLPDNLHTTVKDVAYYYEVDIDAIESHIRHNKDELIEDGMKVLKGKELSAFKAECQIESRAGSLTIIPRRGILRLGMLLRNSLIAKSVRTYLLNVENNADIELKMQSFMEININKLESITQQNVELIDNMNWLNNRVNNLEVKLDNANTTISELKETVVFKQYKNPSYLFNDLIHKFGYKFNIYQEPSQYSYCYKALQDWLGVDFPKVPNTKQYILNTYSIETVEKFVNGVLIGRIVKSDKGHWVDLNGYTKNDIEFEKVKNEFDNVCAYCGKEDLLGLIPEHLIAQSKEHSSDKIQNIIPSCRDCNKDKYDNPVREWYQSKEFYTEERFKKIISHWEKYFIKLNSDGNS